MSNPLISQAFKELKKTQVKESKRNKIMKAIVQFKKKRDITVANEHMKKRELGSRSTESFASVELYTNSNPNTFSNVLSRIPIVPQATHT